MAQTSLYPEPSPGRVTREPCLVGEAQLCSLTQGREWFTDQEAEAGREVICSGPHSGLWQNPAQCWASRCLGLVGMAHALAGGCRWRTGGYWHLSVILIY